MNLEKLKEEIKNFLKKSGYQLYDVTYQKNDSILSVVLDEVLDLKKVEEISNELSTYMDTIDQDMGNYILDVSTVGCEKPIRNEEEIKKAIGSYIYLKTKEVELNGTLLSFEENVIELEYKDKTRVKKMTINYKDVKQMRYAIKF